MRTLVVLGVIAGMSATARADDGVYRKGWVAMTATASSKLDAKHGPEQAFSDGYWTGAGWCAKKGDGIGETLTINFAAPVTLKAFHVSAGMFLGDINPSKKWNLPTQVTIALDDGAATTVGVAADGGASVDVGKAISKVTIGFAKVKKGKKKASCIGEVFFQVDGPADDHFVLVSDPKAVDTIDKDLAAMPTALASCDATQLDATIAFPLAEVKGVPHQGMKSGPHPKKDKVKKVKSSAALVKAKCAMPPFLGTSIEGNPSSNEECFRSGVDKLACTNIAGEDQMWWQLKWTGGTWKLATEVTLPGEASEGEGE